MQNTKLNEPQIVEIEKNNTFLKLKNLQLLVKKESYINELCKYKNR